MWFVFRTFPGINAVLIIPDGVGGPFEDVKTLDVDLTYVNAQSSMDSLPFFKEVRAARINTGETVFLLENINAAENILKSISPA